MRGAALFLSVTGTVAAGRVGRVVETGIFRRPVRRNDSGTDLARPAGDVRRVKRSGGANRPNGHREA
ncbi:hypothetical protein GCM10023107_95730 [Actinoplanes octamycinicus]|nr:hypothetical protein Aoc01nite_21660 [Actinoplanes octamycinicus]